MGMIEDRLEELGLTLPVLRSPAGSYLPLVQVDNMIYTSCTSCFDPNKGALLYVGRIGSDVTVEQGVEAAEMTILNLLTILKAELNTLDRIQQFVKVFGFINSAPDFYRQGEVMNGASNLLIKIFGEKGKHTRSSIGTSNLAFNAPLVIDVTLRV